MNPVWAPVPRLVAPRAIVWGFVPALSRMNRPKAPRTARFGLIEIRESVIVILMSTTGGGAVVRGRSA